ncbi:hypothetical protein CTRI78_v004614 [Colletotrichum trifolii]|uniref:Uncharacterized protein n=1 Tax=Colletotrichum trifolii TaxID=5466 RepID=A0A4R8RGK6_COLTR|nr:hypothetical protein CTRI78_v004614 [Colletotrichum trifolii]
MRPALILVILNVAVIVIAEGCHGDNLLRALERFTATSYCSAFLGGATATLSVPEGIPTTYESFSVSSAISPGSYRCHFNPHHERYYHDDYRRGTRHAFTEHIHDLWCSRVVTYMAPRIHRDGRSHFDGGPEGSHSHERLGRRCRLNLGYNGKRELDSWSQYHSQRWWERCHFDIDCVGHINRVQYKSDTDTKDHHERYYRGFNIQQQHDSRADTNSRGFHQHHKRCAFSVDGFWSLNISRFFYEFDHHPQSNFHCDCDDQHHQQSPFNLDDRRRFDPYCKWQRSEHHDQRSGGYIVNFGRRWFSNCNRACVFL